MCFLRFPKHSGGPLQWGRINQARPCFENEEKTILSTAKKPVALLKGMARFWAILRKNKYDVLITNTAPANIIGNTIGLFAGQKKRISWQTQPPQRISKLFQRLDHTAGRLGIYTRTIANSHWTRACFNDRSQNYLKRMHMITDGISPRVEQRGKAEARQALVLDPNAKIVTTVGRLSKQKGQNTLIEAFRSVPDAKLYLIGDGELRADTEAHIARLGLQDRIHLVGEIPGEQVATYLRASDVFAFPSRWETFGLAIIEAAASGVPLISSDLDVLQEVLSLEDGTPAAMMVPVDEPSLWAKALNDMLNDSDLRQTFSEKSMQISKRHSLENHVDKIEKLVKSI